MHYILQSVGVILGIIAIKMGLETFDVQILSPVQSLALVMSVLGTGVLASLLSKPFQDSTNS